MAYRNIIRPRGGDHHDRAAACDRWDSEEHAAQLDRLKEMAVDARGEAEAAGVTFTPIVNYPVN